MMIFVRLFFEFFKAGLFAIGGGMATLPFLYNISDKTIITPSLPTLPYETRSFKKFSQ